MSEAAAEKRGFTAKMLDGIEKVGNKVPHPAIISESGRAVVAYHSVLVFDILGTSNFDRCTAPDPLRRRPV